MSVHAASPARVGGLRALDVVADDLIDPLWRLYLNAFDHLRTRAVARQVMHVEEFEEMMRAPQVTKFIVFDDDGAPVGLATLTGCLEAVHWISPEYFALRFPAETERGAVFYIPFACTDTGRERPRVFWQLTRAFVAPAAAVNGVLGYDICHFNNQSFDFDRKMEVWYRRLGAFEVQQVDSQNYYVARYGQGQP